MSKQDRYAITSDSFQIILGKKKKRGKENNLFLQFVHSKGLKKKYQIANLDEIRVHYVKSGLISAWLLRAYLVQKYYSILRRQRLPPSNRFKKLLVEVVGQITPAEPYKSTALTIFEITLPLLGVIIPLFYRILT